MKNKKNKYWIGGDPIVDKRTDAQKYAWESMYNSPIVTDPAQAQPLRYDQEQSYRPAPSFLPSQSTQTEETKTGNFKLHPAFAKISALAQAVTGIANAINDGKNSRQEKLKYISSMQNRFLPDNPVLNDQPLYMAFGGETNPVVNNDVRSAWNDYVGWLSANGKKGSPELDANDGGFKMLDQYRSYNPNTILTKDYIKPIQEDFSKYRNWSIDQIKAGKLKVNGNPGSNYENFMPELSTIDGYPGSKTTSHTFPHEYLKTLDENQNTSIQDKGFAKMEDGGKRKAKYGLDDKYSVEAEGGESYTDNNQNVIDIPDSANRHEQGGVDLNNVDRVLEDTSTSRKDLVSQSLKISPQMFNEMFGLKIRKPVSHADALEKANTHFYGQTKKVETGLKKGMEVLEKDKNNVYAKNALDLNLTTVQSIPTKNHIFDLLFEHQENVKDMLGVKADKAKYGKYVAKYGIDPEDDIDPYKGGRTKAGSTTPTGKNNKFIKNKEYYKNLWKEVGIDADSMTNKQFQNAIYDYTINVNPTVAQKMWADFGNTRQGIALGLGKNLDFKNIKEEDLGKLSKAYVDGMVGARTLEPVFPDAPNQDDGEPTRSRQQYEVPTEDQPSYEPPAQPNRDNGFKLKGSGKPSKFNEPLHWYDVASPLMKLANSGRIPANYNPAEFNEVRLKLQNPTPTLEQGNRDYNEALNELPNSGAGMANATNAFASKYSIDNQVLGQYENINSQIKNQETMYNANVRDRQSASDQQSRAVFEQQVLAGKEAQRQQKMQAFDELFSRVAQNRKLNREGNLIMQMTPNYDQYGQYNGNQRYFTSNVNSSVAGGSGIQYVTDPQTGSKYRIMRDSDGKIISSSKIIEDKKASSVR